MNNLRRFFYPILLFVLTAVFLVIAIPVHATTLLIAFGGSSVSDPGNTWNALGAAPIQGDFNTMLVDSNGVITGITLTTPAGTGSTGTPNSGTTFGSVLGNGYTDTSNPIGGFPSSAVTNDWYMGGGQTSSLTFSGLDTTGTMLYTFYFTSSRGNGNATTGRTGDFTFTGDTTITLSSVDAGAVGGVTSNGAAVQGNATVYSASLHANANGTIVITDSAVNATAGFGGYLNGMKIITTPEPSTWALLVGGCGLLAFWRLRMRKENLARIFRSMPRATLPILLGVLLIGFTPARAQVLYQLYFGANATASNPDTTDLDGLGYWTNFNTNPGGGTISQTALLDATSGNASGATVTITGYTQSTANGYSGTALTGLYPAGTNAPPFPYSFFYIAGSPGTVATMTFAGLDPTQSYTFSFLSSRGGGMPGPGLRTTASDIFAGANTVTLSNIDASTADGFGNPNINIAANVKPTADGVITLTATSGTVNGGGITFLQIKVAPEPSTWALLLGGCGLLAFWRLRVVEFCT